MNAGGIRAGIPKGPVMPDAIKSMVPYGNELRLVVANGTIIRAMLEHSVESNDPQGSFLIPSGLRFWWNATAKPLARVTRIEVRRRGNLRRAAVCARGLERSVLQLSVDLGRVPFGLILIHKSAPCRTECEALCCNGGCDRCFHSQ